MQKVIQTSERLISENEEEKSMFLQEGFLVNHFLSPAKEREQRTTVISGLRCSESYKRSGPIGSLLKTLLASSRWYSPVRRLKWEVNPLYSERVSLYLQGGSNMLLKPFAVILNVKDIPSSRYLYRLVASARLTDGIGFGLLPTVTAQDFKLRGPNSRQQGLPEIIREGFLPTPVASDADVGTIIGKDDRIIMSPKGKIRKVNRKGQCWSVGLGRMVELLPTPRANLINGCNLNSPELANRNKGNLEEVISQWIREEMIPTPKGLEVYDIVKEKMIANVSMTGGWECALHEIETGKVSTETFTQSINSYTQQITSELLALKLNHPDLPHCNCLKCGAETIIVFNKVAKCSDPNCGFLLFRTFNGRELTDNQMLLLLSGKRTGYLKFTSKKGKKYEASLELDDNYRIEMTFKDNKPKK